MITFFVILFTLLAINALLLVFSVNGAGDMFKKSTKKQQKPTAPKLLSRNYTTTDTEYKEAV